VKVVDAAVKLIAAQIRDLKSTVDSYLRDVHGRVDPWVGLGRVKIFVNYGRLVGSKIFLSVRKFMWLCPNLSILHQPCNFQLAMFYFVVHHSAYFSCMSGYTRPYFYHPQNGVIIVLVTFVCP